jgi:hypothetical protein
LLSVVALHNVALHNAALQNDAMHNAAMQHSHFSHFSHAGKLVANPKLGLRFSECLASLVKGFL